MRTFEEYSKVKRDAAKELDNLIRGLCIKHSLPKCGLYRGYSDYIKETEGEASFTKYFLPSII